MNWKKYLVISISIVAAVILTRQIIKACADFDYYDSYPQFFGNEAPDKPAYMPFNFIEEDLYYEGGYWNGTKYFSPTDSVNKALILNEWQEFAGTSVKKADIEKLLYHTSIQSILALENKHQNDSDNSFVTYLLGKKNKAVLSYVIYAKKCERNALVNSEDWIENKDTSFSVSNNLLKEQGLEAIEKVSNSFLRMKYAFQILRMAFYDKRYAEVLNLYKSLLQQKEDKSTAYTRCLGFKAGALFRLGDRVKAGYYYTKMFGNSNAYKKTAMISFEWSVHHDDENNFSKIYALCQNDHERAIALEMKTLRETNLSLKNIKNIYQLDPQGTGMGVLINREINKLEQFFFSNKVYAQNNLSFQYQNYYWYYNPYTISKGKTDSLNKVYLPYIQELNSFLNLLISDKKTGNPALWHLAKAYLGCMQGRPQTMYQELALAQSAGMNSNETTTYKVIDLLYTIYNSPDITEETESVLLPKLKALDQLAKNNGTAAQQFRDIMTYLIAGKYFQQGDTIKGIYAMGHAQSWKTSGGKREFYVDQDFQDRQGEILNNMSVKELRKVIAYRIADNKSAFENWLVNETYYTPIVLEDLLGTQYIRNRNFRAAEKIFNQPGMTSQKFPDPFMPHINDYLELTRKDTLETFTKLSFTKRMADLQETITKNPNDAGALYGYAVALYNISYYGKAADITNYFRHSYDEMAYYSGNWKLPDYLEEYYRVKTAEQYFNKAANAATDPELKAKAVWGAAKCWTKSCSPATSPNNYYLSNDNYDRYYSNALNNPYFKTLSDDYAHTKFMQKVRTTCEYYSDYLKE